LLKKPACFWQDFSSVLTARRQWLAGAAKSGPPPGATDWRIEKVYAMRRARVILLILLIAIGATAYHGFQNGWQLPGVPETAPPSVSPPPAQQVSESGKPVRPTFDVVRAEPTGELIIAGRAEPGWAVSVESNGKPIGSAMADDQGEWVIQPETAVTMGEHSLELKSQSPKGKQLLFSKQRLALSIGEPTKSRPLVALTEEGQPTRVLQMPAGQDERRTAGVGTEAAANLQNPPFKPSATGDASPAQVSFTSLDYEQVEGRNTVYLTGRATPGARIMLYVNNEFTGTTTADATGSWSFKGLRELNDGKHILRADHVEIAAGKVVARAEVNFDREVPKAIAQGTGDALALAAGSAQQRPRTELAEAGRTANKANDSANFTAPDPAAEPNVITVRRGDTLWQIAQRYYGNGAKYTQIFQTNKGQIRDPNLIYPTQRINMTK
jgi:nucleoid-associated protein YgaU